MLGPAREKGGKARAKGGPQRVAKDKKEKTQEQIDMKELQKDVKSFPGVERTFVYKVELSTFISTKYVSPNVGQLHIPGYETMVAKPGNSRWTCSPWLCRIWRPVQ